MTREEAKKILEAYIACESKKAHFKCSEYNCDDDCPLLYGMGTVGEYNEAINMAIQALEQEPCEDAINREDAIKQCGFGMTSLLIADNLRKLPSVKPQEPTGHWIIMGDRYIKCSKCGHITKTESPDIYHFCMVCGANMSEIPTSSKPEISSYYGLKSYVRERSEE